MDVSKWIVPTPGTRRAEEKIYTAEKEHDYAKELKKIMREHDITKPPKEFAELPEAEIKVIHNDLIDRLESCERHIEELTSLIELLLENNNNE